MNQSRMDLRAFFNNTLKVARNVFFIFPIFTFSVGFAQNANLRESKVPYEIKFADVTFQLNDVTRFLMSQEVISFSKNQDTKLEYLKKLSLVLPQVEPIIQKANVPSDFKYLAIYNRFQKSLVSNVVLDQGVFWCLDAEKSKDVDLIIDDRVDERKHLIMATKGAIVCLKRNQVLYENWGTTLFSHLASREVINLLEINRKWAGSYIVLDSPVYSSLIQFLAFKWVLEAEFNGFKNPEPKVVYEYKNGAGKSLNLIAADLKVDTKELLQSNLWLKTNRVPEGDANILVVVPASKFNEIRVLDEMSKNVGIQNMDLGFPLIAPNPKLSKGIGGMFYTINNLDGIQAEMCDDFVNLAYKADISNEKFLAYNDMSDKDFLQIGQVYYIESKKDKATIPHHIVKNEETLWEISQQYGVKLDELLKYNRMETVGRLQRGRVIWMQSKRPKKQAIEYIEFPIENKEEKPDRLKFDDELITEYVNSKTVDEPIVKKEEPFKFEVLQKNTEKEEPIVVKEVKTAQVENTKPFSEELKEEIVVPKNSEKGYVVHEVKKGETLYRISVNYRVSVDQLYKLNNLKNNTIEVGDKIIVKRY